MMNIEADLAALRWPTEHVDLPLLLSRIGNFADYQLVLIIMQPLVAIGGLMGWTLNTTSCLWVVISMSRHSSDFDI